MKGQKTRGKHNLVQLKLNEQKREKTRTLIGKTFVDQGQMGRVMDVDYKTGEALVRFKGMRIHKSYHPDRIEELMGNSGAI